MRVLERDHLQRLDGSALGVERHDTRAGHQHHQGQLFPQKQTQRHGFGNRWDLGATPSFLTRLPVLGRSPAAERPVVEQQQDGGQCDQHRLGQQPQHERQHHAQVAQPAGPADIVDIGPQGQHPEQGAQDVLALRHPGHRLHVQGMDRKQGGHKGTAPGSGRQAIEDAEKEQDVGQVQQQVGQVVAEGPGPKEFCIELQRQPGQRVPVAGVEGRPGPMHVRRGQAGQDVTVLQHIDAVIVIDEAVEADRRKAGYRHHGERQTDQQKLTMNRASLAGGL